MYYKQSIGKNGEYIATEYLQKKGYKILDKNFRCNQGEIDIVALDKEEIVFVEVKTRSNQQYGLASEAVNKQKKRHLINAIKYYVYIRNLENEFIRIDVIEIYIKKGKVYIHHIKQALS